MNKNWLIVVISAVFEVCWVIGLKHADSLLAWAGTIISIIISFLGMIIASRYLPVGTVYAVFVGLGTVGTILSEIIFFKEPISIGKILLIFLLLIGVMGLKFVTNDKAQKGSDT